MCFTLSFINRRITGRNISELSPDIIIDLLINRSLLSVFIRSKRIIFFLFTKTRRVDIIVVNEDTSNCSPEWVALF